MMETNEEGRNEGRNRGESARDGFYPTARTG